METTKKLARSTLAIIVFSLLGKILGFVRESLTAARFGATLEMDAFTASQSATATISMLITAAIATIFIPSLQKAERELGEEEKLKFTNNMLMIISLISLIVIALGIVFAPALSILFTPKSKLEAYELVVKLIKIGMPVVIFSAVVGVFTGFLQYEGKFAAAGAVAIPLNLVYVIYLGFISPHAGIVGLTIASVVGILAQVIFLLPDSFKAGYRPKFVFNLKDKYVNEALLLAVPILISTAVNDVNVIVNRRLAMGMVEGSASVLNYANKMNMMILGIFITAITAIIFPTMSRAFGNKDMIHGKRVMNASVKTVLFLTVPATIGMLILARPIVDVAFFHGKFTLQNAIDTTATLRFYTLALISISLSNVLNRVYYSIADTKTPFIIGLINVSINVGLNLLVAHKFGTRGLAASVSIATTVAVLISFILLREKIGNLGIKSYVKALVKTLMSSTAMGIFCLIYFPIEKVLTPLMHSHGSSIIIKLLLLMIVVGIAAIIYGLCLYHLGVREIRDVVKIINRRLKKAS
ncbi:murein biosynthesis integral membrane protein MurJ [Peptoniphilus sp. oral taxon 386]|uniref:murein biosynthesis integral membrane protein MurJ n=1 Tax=Peptoniphilus sp. oral taxon 386 TaxID=652713 RepID=UPI0001DA9E71|nr:murein biosynthesis integral membrane protein MurJ [Peptoniphilus sp. oral taxon 386]EFI41499.1 integral membrane protein MviN [Peptoniphilus sp. oral taxon 386 str. F0131]